MTRLTQYIVRRPSRLLLAVTSAIFLSAPVHGVELNIYALGHVSIDTVDDGLQSSIYIASNSSRIGFNGEHQLSDDLTVIFQYESGLDLTAQGGNDGNGGAESSGQILTKGRPSYLGLKGEFGTILLGHLNFLDQYANDYNPFADQIGDLGNFWEANGIPGRSDNVIYYKTNNMAGFDVAATYAPEEGINDSDYLLLKGSYTQKDLNMGLVYTHIGQGEGVDNQHTGLAFVMDYDFGSFSLGGGYQAESDIGGQIGNDRNSFTVAGIMPVGSKGKIKAQFANSLGQGADNDATQFALGYDYAFDEQTTFYIAYASTQNDDKVNFSVNGKGKGDKVTPLFGNDPNAISLGVIYTFSHQLIQ
jgi:predicted porin